MPICTRTEKPKSSNPNNTQPGSKQHPTGKNHRNPPKPGGGDSSAAPAGLIGVEEWRSPNPPGGARSAVEPPPLSHVERGGEHLNRQTLGFTTFWLCFADLLSWTMECTYFSDLLSCNFRKCSCFTICNPRGGEHLLTRQTLSFTTFFFRTASVCEN